MMDNRDTEPLARLYRLAFSKRPAEELYDLKRDPGQLDNLIDRAAYRQMKESLNTRLMKYLKATGDPRALGKTAPWDGYPYYGRRRNPDWAVENLE